jgi:hypothetical protein
MVSIECILHGSLEDYLPAGHRNSQACVEFETTPSVGEILAHFEIDRDYLQFVLADGCYFDLQN